MTYRLDSDIPIPYGKIVPKEILSSEEIELKIQEFGQENAEKYMVNDTSSQKERMSKCQHLSQVNLTRPRAAWFVSNCHTPGRREEVVTALRSSSALAVDIFGSCGDK